MDERSPGGMRRRAVAGAAVAILAWMASPATIRAQSTMLVAAVADARTGAPLRDAEVVLPALHRLARTDWLGQARIGAIPPGRQRVRVRKLGYAAADLELLFQGDSIGPVFMLEPQPATLQTVRVRAKQVPLRLQPFEDRRRMGIGRFLTEAQLDTEADRDFALVAESRFPGLRTGMDSEGNEHVVSTRVACSGTHCGPCAVRVVLDNMTLPPEDFALVRTWDLAGVEYYSGESMPVQYRRGGSACGLLLLWSK